MTGSEGCGEEVSLELRLQRVWSPEAREEGRERERANDGDRGRDLGRSDVSGSCSHTPSCVLLFPAL